MLLVVVGHSLSSKDPAVSSPFCLNSLGFQNSCFFLHKENEQPEVGGTLDLQMPLLHTTKLMVKLQSPSGRMRWQTC